MTARFCAKMPARDARSATLPSSVLIVMLVMSQFFDGVRLLVPHSDILAEVPSFTIAPSRVKDLRLAVSQALTIALVATVLDVPQVHQVA